jgi:uncharacterized membrane protein
MVDVLFVGEYLTTHILFNKGWLDFMYGSQIKDESAYFKEALLSSGFKVTHIPTYTAGIEFPENLEEMSKYNVIILSDVGSNTLILHPDVVFKGKPRPNRLKLIKEYVEGMGGGFLMIGGYFSYQGLNGFAHYKNTPVEEILPVELMEFDDRIEIPEGFKPKIVESEHAILKDLPTDWPILFGYNKTKLKKKAELLIEYNGDPILAVWNVGNGRAASFTSDCAPHWASPEFLNWQYYKMFWRNVILWLAKQDKALAPI